MIWKLSERKDWNSLEQQFGWVRDMNQVPQHTVHHAEGSVAVHTRMVLEALLRQPAYPMLPEQEREILWAAALLHDVENVRLQSMRGMDRLPLRTMLNVGRLLSVLFFIEIYLLLSIYASI